jgi:transglutaminase-like putative cysteine protease
MTPRTAERAEDSKGFRVAVLVALLAAGCAALQEGAGGPLLRVVVLVGYPVAFLIAYMTRNRRPPLLRLAITAAAAAVLLIFAASLTGQPLAGFAALQVPLVEVFLWLLLVHAVDSPGRRALLISLLSSVVIVAVAGVLSVSMEILPFLAVWGVAAITSLVLGQRAALASLPALSARTPRRGRASLGSAFAIIVTLLVVAVLGAGVFMVAPVAGTNRALTFPAQLPRTENVPVLGGLANPSLGSGDPSGASQPGVKTARASFGYFGFSTQLDTATRGRPDNTLVMRVRSSAPDFWRGQSFDDWDGRVWRVSRSRPTAIRGFQPIEIPRATDDGPAIGAVGADELVQTYYIERNGPNAIFAAPSPKQLYFPDQTVFQMPDGSLRAAVQLDEGSVYTVVSRRWLATEEALRASDPARVTEDIRTRYASAPVTTERVRELAQRITANAPTSYDKVRALEAWMGANTKYTLNIPPLPAGKDAVDQFLFVDQRGFCEQIGTSLVVMLRSLGIPARLAVGYATGERNPFTGLYEVRAKDAHAWAEVYFPGLGWQGFDPTASVPLAGDSSIDAAGSGALAYLNARISVPSWAPAVLGILVLGFGLAFGARFLMRRRRRRETRVEPSWAATRLVQLERLGVGLGRARAPGETTPEYANALAQLDPFAAESVRTVARVLDAAMFSPYAATADDRAAVDEALTDLEERWRHGRRSSAPVLVSS